jgi:uncharacterized protein (TIGR00369 family)
MGASGGFRDEVGLWIEESGEGRPTVLVDATDRHLNEGGTVHGGVLATLVDAAMGTAVGETGDDDERPVTVSLTVTYLKPGKPGRIIASAELRKRGKRLSVVEADVVQEETGDTVAHAVGTFSVTS